MLTPLSSVLSLGNKVPIVVSFAPLGLQYWPALHPCRSLPHYCQLCLTSDICPVPTEQYLSLPHPGNSCKSLSPPVAPQLPLSFGSKMGGMSKPWPLFPAWPNPTSPPILEKKVGTEGCPSSNPLPLMVYGAPSAYHRPGSSLTLALRRQMT